MNKTKSATNLNTSEVNRKYCFYCLGDRPDVHCVLPDLVVLYIAERATSFEEALQEYKEFETEMGERMRLDVIIRSDSARYFETFK